MRTLVPILALVLAACSPQASISTVAETPEPAAPQGRQGRIDRVLDGDSLRIVIEGVSIEVRLLGINAPERDECWAEESRSALTAATAGRRLTVVGGEVDHYGRGDQPQSLPG